MIDQSCWELIPAMLGSAADLLRIRLLINWDWNYSWETLMNFSNVDADRVKQGLKEKNNQRQLSYFLIKSDKFCKALIQWFIKSGISITKKIFFFFIRTSPLYPSDLKLPSPGAPEFINFPKALVSVVFLRKYFTGLVLRVFDNLISACNHVRQTMK